MRVIINGALGRMGKAVIARTLETGNRVVAKVDRMIEDDGVAVLSNCDVEADVVIDFTSPSALDELLLYALKTKTPVVLGTTGYTDSDLQKIAEASKQVALFKSANMSLGVNVLKKLIQKAAVLLGEDFDIEIIETHHSQKKDAPSGTALLLYNALNDAFHLTRTQVHGRDGAECKRHPKEIGIHAVRGGTVPGIHEVCFLGANETLTLTHSAQSRDVFAAGAVRAAQYLCDTKASSGLFSMEDLLSSAYKTE